MFALSQAMDQGRVPHAEITIVISDQPAAVGLTKARGAGLKTRVIQRTLCGSAGPGGQWEMRNSRAEGDHAELDWETQD